MRIITQEDRIEDCVTQHGTYKDSHLKESLSTLWETQLVIICQKPLIHTIYSPPRARSTLLRPKAPSQSIPSALKSLWAKDKECTDFLKDETVKAKFAKAKTLSDVDVAKYDVIFYPGGHAPSYRPSIEPIEH
ncbi:hypothetical protein C8J56DRAFT_1116969 [Mycena floridula]|nr:hypothetical protein C8J56DRAFT_1116969 [Mycena floridula]